MANKTIKAVTANFFNVMVNVIAKNSSKEYAIVVIKGIKKSVAMEFPFVRLVEMSNSSFKIDDKINNVNPMKVGKLFVRVIDMLGQNLLKLLIKKELKQEDVQYLDSIGVRF